MARCEKAFNLKVVINLECVVMLQILDFALKLRIPFKNFKFESVSVQSLEDFWFVVFLSF